jgi:hypothetical protein
MNRRTILLLGAFGALAAAAPAEGQRKPVRTGTATSAPPAQPIPASTAIPVAPNPATQPVPTGTPIYLAPNQVPVAKITWYPTIVLADGRVLANFGTGHGYEEVLRRCPDLSGPLPPNATIAPCFTKDAYGNYRVMQRR